MSNTNEQDPENFDETYGEQSQKDSQEHNEQEHPEPIHEPMSEQEKLFMIDDFTDMIETGEEFLQLRAEFMKKWQGFLVQYSDELASDPNVVKINQRAVNMNTKMMNV
jgi:hypothetical protein